MAEESKSTARCPNCGSTQIGGGRAGGVGMAMENPYADGIFMGAKTQGVFICTCIACGFEWSPARLAEEQRKTKEQEAERQRLANRTPAQKYADIKEQDRGYTSLAIMAFFAIGCWPIGFVIWLIVMAINWIAGETATSIAVAILCPGSAVLWFGAAAWCLWLVQKEHNDFLKGQAAIYRLEDAIIKKKPAPKKKDE